MISDTHSVADHEKNLLKDLQQQAVRRASKSKSKQHNSTAEHDDVGNVCVGATQRKYYTPGVYECVCEA